MPALQELRLPADPEHYAPLEYHGVMKVPAHNPMSAAKATLGWQLFFEDYLSGDGTRSCASCHVGEHGLTDGLPSAIGAFGLKHDRHTPTLWNIGYHLEEGERTVEERVQHAWRDGLMGANREMEAILKDLNAIAGYRARFRQIFGEKVRKTNVIQALACYVRTLISRDTPFDRWQAGDQTALDRAAKRGLDLFNGKAGCAACHPPPLFTDRRFHEDGGFTTPTLRDIVDTAPYLHDGSVKTLRQAVEVMKKKSRLTEKETADLLEFLKALDETARPERPVLP